MAEKISKNWKLKIWKKKNLKTEKEKNTKQRTRHSLGKLLFSKKREKWVVFAEKKGNLITKSLYVTVKKKTEKKSDGIDHFQNKS